MLPSRLVASLALLCSFLLIAPSAASADPTFLPPGTGDWFDPSSWSGGAVPTPTDTPILNDGGTATAAPDSPFYPGTGTLVEGDSLVIGSQNMWVPGDDVSGHLAVSGIDVDIGDSIWVGSNTEQTGTRYDGSLTVDDGALDVLRNLTVGSARNVGDAVGSVRVTGDLSAFPYLVVPNPTGSHLNFLKIAEGRSGAVDGTVEVGGDLLNFSWVEIAESRAVGGRAHATVEVAGDFIGRDMDGGPMVIGSASGGSLDGTRGGQATGTVSIGGDLSGFGYRDGQACRGCGLVVGGASSLGTGTGSLTVAGDVYAPTWQVGMTLSPGTTAHSGHGTGTIVIGGDLINGAIQAGLIGFDSGFDPTAFAQARGTIEIAGSIDGGGVILGSASGPGIAVATLHVGGDVNRGPSDSPFRNFHIGLTQVSDRAKASGRMVVEGSIGDATRPQQFEIGSSRDSLGIASGYLETDGIENASRMRIGSSGAPPRPPTFPLPPGAPSPPEPAYGTGVATGHLLVRSGGIASSGARSSLRIGHSRAKGTAHGTVEVTGDVIGFEEILVGIAESDRPEVGVGTSTGIFDMQDGLLTGGTLKAGIAAPGGTATGVVALERVLAQLDVSTELGPGSTLELTIQGTSRGTEYSAIDTPTAILDGLLRVGFAKNSPVEVGDVFDLIVSGSDDGITGMFSAVELVGIDPELVRYGVELISSASGPVEAFRLRIVPEPGTAVLVSIGLVMIAGRRRTSPTRRSRAAPPA